MRLPQWIRVLLAGTLVSVFAWALKDRMAIGERIATVEQWFQLSEKRLERIEVKLDKALEKK